ncbi:MAG: hypothetical protein JW746_01445 [Candidatus Krumholzibacteriota bacterium]|nr:hypothetical protein [Candidatus Krumholzibacteriota bacterium]
MKSEKSRTPEEIFKDMHLELRAWNTDIPESPDRMDPVLRILMRMYASQLAALDKKVVHTWEAASDALVRSLCPESIRWPVPSFTVMQAETSDPVIKVDPQTQFFYKEERDNGRTFFFSSLRTERLLNAKLENIYFVSGDNVEDISPSRTDSTRESSPGRPSSFSGQNAELFLAVSYDGPADDFKGSVIFLQGDEDALKQLRWAKWLPCIDGDFYERGYFCPGASGSIDEIFSNEKGTIDWGSLRRSADLFRPLENRFAVVSDQFITAWRSGSPGEKVLDRLRSSGVTPPEMSGKMFWIKIVLPSGGDRTVFKSSFNIHFDCFVAVNKFERTLFKHTGGNRLIEIEIPDDLDSILKIISVTDSNGRKYLPRHEVLSGEESGLYTLLEQNKKLSLWLDFSSELELPPDSLTVNYSLTAGTEAGGISAGKITELYESHPGIISVKNIIPVSGAIPAKTEKQVIAEISSRLRGRDRAMSFDQIRNWVGTFDGRITGVDCQKGVMRTGHGVRKCVVVVVSVSENEFHSDDEIGLLKARLGSFLKARTSINSQFKLEIVKV